LFVIVAEAFHRGLFHGAIIWKPGLALSASSPAVKGFLV
jgi:hypothetical protein